MGKNTFEENLENLDKIIESLESGELSLDDAIREYECIISNDIADFTPLLISSFNKSSVAKSKNGLNLFPPFKMAYSIPLAIVSG